MNRLQPPLILLSLLLAAACRPVAPAMAQEVASTVAVSSADSVRHHRSARSRQAAFERARREKLPWAWGGGGGGACDERIGRFCLTYTDDRPEWEPPEEDASVGHARERLLQELATTAAAIPGDRWVVGQRVRYLVEAGRYEEAVDAARACRGERWWCDALTGFAQHRSGDAEAAESAFERMLATMPAETRDEWTDLSPILETPTLRTYRRLEPEDQDAFEARFWTLTDPLVQTGGNDVRSEHFTRHLLAELQDRAESPENIRWGNDLREIIVRFGAPSGWERIRPAHQLQLGEVSIVTHYPDSDIDLLPPAELLSDFDPAAVEWNDENLRARASYPLTRAGERLRWFTPLDHQVAVFRGADSAFIVVAYQLPADSLSDDSRVDAVVSARTGTSVEPLLVRQRDAAPADVLGLAVPHEPLLVSLELLASAEHRAARARFGLEIPSLIPGVLAASDLLILHAPEDSIAESREEALRLARGSVRVNPGERLGVYWEIYSPGVPWPEGLEVSLRLVDADAGWLRRLAERVGVVEQAQPIRLVWEDATAGEETIRRTLTLQVPDDVHPGRYTLELTLTAPGREPLISRKELVVVQ